MKYFSKTANTVADKVLTILDLKDNPSFTSVKLTLQLNFLASTEYTVSLRGANGSKFDLVPTVTTAASASSVDITDVVLNVAALPGTASPLSAIEILADKIAGVYLLVEKLED